MVIFHSYVTGVYQRVDPKVSEHCTSLVQVLAEGAGRVLLGPKRASGPGPVFLRPMAILFEAICQSRIAFVLQSVPVHFLFEPFLGHAALCTQFQSIVICWPPCLETFPTGRQWCGVLIRQTHWALDRSGPAYALRMLRRLSWKPWLETMAWSLPDLPKSPQFLVPSYQKMGLERWHILSFSFWVARGGVPLGEMGWNRWELIFLADLAVIP